MKNIFDRLKTDKDFRYDFFIALWSGIIIIAVVIALIFGVIYFADKMNDKAETPKATSTPAVSASPSPQPTPTATPDSLIDDDEPDSTGEPDKTGTDEDGDEDNGDNDDKDSDEHKNSSSSDTVYATTTVNVREDASTSSASLGRITAGSSVERIESLSNGWSKVDYKGKTAYIKSEYLTTQHPDGKTAAPRTSTPSTSQNKPKATNAPAKTEKPAKTSKPKATKKPDDMDEDSDTSEAEDYPKVTSVPPPSDNLTGTDMNNYQDSPSGTANPDAESD